MFDFSERERERMEEKRERVDERKKNMMTSTVATTLAKESEENEVETNDELKDKVIEPKKTLRIEVHATATHHAAEHIEPVVAHAQAHQFSHNQGVSSIYYI